MISRQKKTFNQKYGVDFYPEHKDFVTKQRETKKIKYGNENYTNVIKQKNTKLEKYGDVNFNNVEKHKVTCLSKYGTDNYAKSNNYQNQINEKFKSLYPDVKIQNVNKK
jgi:hypothetical protein